MQEVEGINFADELINVPEQFRLRSQDSAHHKTRNQVLSRTLQADTNYRPMELIEHRIQLKDRARQGPPWQVSRQFAMYIDQSLDPRKEGHRDTASGKRLSSATRQAHKQQRQAAKSSLQGAVPTGRGGGLILGSSSSRDGLKLRRRQSQAQSKLRDERKRSNFLVLNAVTTHRVPQNNQISAKMKLHPRTQLGTTKDSSNYEALVTMQQHINALERVQMRSRLVNKRVSTNAGHSEGDNMMGMLNMANVDVQQIYQPIEPGTFTGSAAPSDLQNWPGMNHDLLPPKEQMPWTSS